MSSSHTSTLKTLVRVLNLYLSFINEELRFSGLIPTKYDSSGPTKGSRDMEVLVQKSKGIENHFYVQLITGINVIPR